jgi:AcrR family transcriptional regulator
MHVTPAPDGPSSGSGSLFGLTLEERVVLAARACVAERGLADTTVDDIAAAAGCSRASVYRVFPGGRRKVLRELVDSEVDGLLAGLAADVDAAPDLAAAVAGAVHTASTLLAAHPALQRLLSTEPGAVLPYISFDGAAPLLARAAAWGRSHLARFLPADDAEAVGEWAARLVLSHLHTPSDLIVLTDPTAVRHLVATYLMPGLPDLSGIPAAGATAS